MNNLALSNIFPNEKKYNVAVSASNLLSFKIEKGQFILMKRYFDVLLENSGTRGFVENVFGLTNFTFLKNFNGEYKSPEFASICVEYLHYLLAITKYRDYAIYLNSLVKTKVYVEGDPRIYEDTSRNLSAASAILAIKPKSKNEYIQELFSGKIENTDPFYSLQYLENQNVTYVHTIEYGKLIQKLDSNLLSEGIIYNKDGKGAEFNINPSSKVLLLVQPKEEVTIHRIDAIFDAIVKEKEVTKSDFEDTQKYKQELQYVDPKSEKITNLVTLYKPIQLLKNGEIEYIDMIGAYKNLSFGRNLSLKPKQFYYKIQSGWKVKNPKDFTPDDIDEFLEYVNAKLSPSVKVHPKDWVRYIPEKGTSYIVMGTDGATIVSSKATYHHNYFDYKKTENSKELKNYCMTEFSGNYIRSPNVSIGYLLWYSLVINSGIVHPTTINSFVHIFQLTNDWFNGIFWLRLG